jgi:hypothetical protein
MKTKLRINVVCGKIDGKKECSISWTRPLELDTDGFLILSAIVKNLSTKLYRAHKLGAQ